MHCKSYYALEARPAAFPCRRSRVQPHHVGRRSGLFRAHLSTLCLAPCLEEERQNVPRMTLRKWYV